MNAIDYIHSSTGSSMTFGNIPAPLESCSISRASSLISDLVKDCSASLGASQAFSWLISVQHWLFQLWTRVQSPDLHHWLHVQQLGILYKHHRFSINSSSNGIDHHTWTSGFSISRLVLFSIDLKFPMLDHQLGLWYLMIKMCSTSLTSFSDFSVAFQSNFQGTWKYSIQVTQII